MNRKMNGKINVNKIAGVENLYPNFDPKEGHITTHDFFYTPTKYPMTGAVTYICHGMPGLFLQNDVYALHRLRSLWMAERGMLQLVIGEVWRNPVNNNLWTFANDCIIIKSKPGALRINKKHFIKFQVMTAPDQFAGSVRIELDGETALNHIFNHGKV